MVLACKVMDVGTIQIMMHDGIVRTMSEVRHAQKLTINLIAMTSLDGIGSQFSKV